MRRLPSRTPARRVGALLMAVLFAVTTVSSPAAAAPARARADAIGGPAMATTGTVSAAGAPALPPGISAAGFVVADLDSGAVYAARNPHVRALPASTIKTLTALVLLPELDPHQVLVANAADANTDGTRVGVVPDGKYTVDQLFQALLMMSANDAAELLARAGGSRSQTLAEMNAKARTLQAFDTYARTPSGLDAPGQTTSAYDLALINRATMALPAFRRYVSMRRTTFGAAGGAHFAIQNHNKMFRDNYPGAIGIKNGYTDVARYSYIGAATRAGHTYLVSMVRADRAYAAQAEALLSWAFALPSDVAPVGQLVDPVVAHEPTPGAAAAAGTAALTGSSGGRGRAGWLLGAGGIAVLFLAAMTVFVRRASRRRTTPGW